MFDGVFRSIFSTPYGNGSVQASDRGILKVDLPDISLAAPAYEEDVPGFKASRLTEYAAELLQRYFSGEPVGFEDIPVDLPSISPFRYKALQVIRGVPYGHVRSYGQIAAECGSPRAARAVGGAMAANPLPVIIPCHRIVASNGRLTGYSAPGGEIAKLVLLKMEGVEFKGLLAIENRCL